MPSLQRLTQGGQVAFTYKDFVEEWLEWAIDDWSIGRHMGITATRKAAERKPKNVENSSPSRRYHMAKVALELGFKSVREELITFFNSPRCRYYMEMMGVDYQEMLKELKIPQTAGGKNGV